MLNAIASLFYIDNLSMIMMTLVLLIGTTLCFFSKKYMHGDTHQNRFMTQLMLLCLSSALLFTANNVMLLLVLWGFTQYLLVRLMRHYHGWNAAINSSRLAGQSLGAAGLFISVALGAFYFATGEVSVQAIIHHPAPQPVWVNMGLGFLLLGVMIQSAIWPFHRWLLSSMNAPTPVSAMMHAGLINGGGYLLALFSPLYMSSPHWLSVMLVLGLVTAVIGILWKLVQPDVKRMLACSTMGQMGFMLAQCGLGLFPAAIAHLCWHGMFKAYLFLNSGSAVHKHPIPRQGIPSVAAFFIAIGCAVIGTVGFVITSGEGIPPVDSRWVLISVAFITGIQLALSLLESVHWKHVLSAFFVTTGAGLLYGVTVGIFYDLLPNLTTPVPLNALHVVAVLVLTVSWFGMLLARAQTNSLYSTLMKRIYVLALNASQPHPSTITAHRNDYTYL